MTHYTTRYRLSCHALSGLALVLLFTAVMGVTAIAGERTVLVELFTNSHCSQCPPAHAAIDAYMATSANGHRVLLISYHTLFPYSSDALAQSNTADPAARYSYYGSSSSTPITYFDGVDQGRSYSAWAGALDARAGTDSPLEIAVTGTRNGSVISVQCAVQRTATIAQSDLVLHVAVVESPSYVGGNGVSSTNVVRRLLTPAGGTAVQFDGSGSATVSASGTVTNADDVSSTSIVAFVQSFSTKTVYQAVLITYSSLTGTGADPVDIPASISLEQNYPNPFNPSTRIAFSIDQQRPVTLKVVDLLGRTVAVLLDRTMPAGSFTETWDATGYPSGTYLAVLESGRTRMTTRMLLVR